MSARQELAQRIADFIRTNNLTTPYGGDVAKHGNHYTVLFSYPRNVDGAVNVYGPKFIQVTWMTQYRDLTRQGNRVFESESNAVDFIDKAFITLDFDRAMAVPHKAK